MASRAHLDESSEYTGRTGGRRQARVVFPEEKKRMFWQNPRVREQRAKERARQSKLKDKVTEKPEEKLEIYPLALSKDLNRTSEDCMITSPPLSSVEQQTESGKGFEVQGAIQPAEASYRDFKLQHRKRNTLFPIKSSRGMDYTSSIEQQAEESGKAFEAQSAVTPAVAGDQTRELQDRVNNLLNENQGLETKISKLGEDIASLHSQLDIATAATSKHMKSYQELEQYVWPLQETLKPPYNEAVDENGLQPATWVLHYCRKQFESLLKDRDIMEAAHRQEKEKLQEQVLEALGFVEDAERKMNQMNHEHRTAVGRLEEKHKSKLNEMYTEIARMESGLLTNVDPFQPIPDSVFKKRFTDLRWLVENVARSLPDLDGDVMGRVFRESDFFRASEFVEIAPRKHWRFLLEGTFWYIIIRGLFHTPFSAFGNYGSEYLDDWHDLFDQQRHRPEPSSENWRAITFETVNRQREQRPKLKESCEVNVRKVSEELAAVLESVSQQSPSRHKPDDIRKIVDQAYLLALDMGIQRSKLTLSAPPLGERVKRNSRTYTDINNNNAHDITSGIVQLVAIPGLRRYGDVRGRIFDGEAVDVLPASVYLTNT